MNELNSRIFLDGVDPNKKNNPNNNSTNKNQQNNDKNENKSDEINNNNEGDLGGNNNNKNPNPSFPSQNTTPLPKQKKSKLVKWLWITIFVLLTMFIFSSIFFPSPELLSREEFFDKLASYYYTSEGNFDISKESINIYTNINNGYYTYAYYTIDKTTYYTLFDSDVHFDFYWTNFIESYPEVAEKVSVLPTNPQPGIIWYIFVQWLPWIIMIVIAWVLIKMIMEKQSSIGKMNKKSLLPQISNIKFADVEGYLEVKQELIEIVDFLKNPIKYSEVAARTPKGVLLSGPPGTGKTLFAKAIAGESQIPFYSISGSDFVEMYVGVGASRVRTLFSQAKLTAPSLIFIDELDAVGRSRGAGVGGGNDEREQTLNQLLVEMDGFSSNEGIIVIAATNRPDVLDPAIKRPGRFDRSVEIRLPDIREREAILKLHAKRGNNTFASDVDWLNISMRTPGFSGAELENVINESKILSVRLNKKEIDLEIIDEAIDRVIGGPAKVNNAMSKEEKKLVAYHEAGHALIGLVLDNAEKVQKISIVPRGQAGGYVLMTPKKEKIVQTKIELFSKIISFMGGRVSEEIFFGEENISTGAYSDIQEATKIARRMVTEFGMSKLGPIQYEKNYGSPFMGAGHYSQEKFYSDRVSFEIDQEISKIINDSYKKAKEVIMSNKSMIELFAEALILKEILNSEDIEYIFKNKKLTPSILKIKEKIEKNKNKKNTQKTKTTKVKKELQVS